MAPETHDTIPDTIPAPPPVISGGRKRWPPGQYLGRSLQLREERRSWKVHSTPPARDPGRKPIRVAKTLPTRAKMQVALRHAEQWGGGKGRRLTDVWQPGTMYEEGARVCSPHNPDRVLVCERGGTSGEKFSTANLAIGDRLKDGEVRAQTVHFPIRVPRGFHIIIEGDLWDVVGHDEDGASRLETHLIWTVESNWMGRHGYGALAMAALSKRMQMAALPVAAPPLVPSGDPAVDMHNALEEMERHMCGGAPWRKANIARRRVRQATRALASAPASARPELEKKLRKLTAAARKAV